MTDYAHLDHPENLPFKMELKKVLDILNENNVHYWADFATLSKITDKRDDKYLYYLNTFELGLYDDSRLIIEEIIRVHNLSIFNRTSLKIDLYTPDTVLFNTLDPITAAIHPVKERALLWISFWFYKDAPDHYVHLDMANDFVIKKSLFAETEMLDYCDLKIKIPKNRKELYDIRFGDKKGVIFSHSPKKRVNCEKDFGFYNLGNYK